LVGVAGTDPLEEEEPLGNRERSRPGHDRARRAGLTSRGEIERLSSREIYQDERNSVRLDQVRYPAHRGSSELGTGQRLVVTYSDPAHDGVVLVALRPDHKILLVEQYRYAVSQWMCELPRGYAARGEPAVDAAIRQLGEETGYEPLGLPVHLGRVVPDSSKVSDAPHILLVPVKMRPTQLPSPKCDEPIRGTPQAVTFRDLYARCTTGEICDGFTLAAVIRLHPHFPNGERFEPDHQILGKPYLAEAEAAFAWAEAPLATQDDTGHWERWLSEQVDRGTAAVQARTRQMEALGVIDARGNVLSEVLPRDMLPGSKSSVAT